MIQKTFQKVIKMGLCCPYRGDIIYNWSFVIYFIYIKVFLSQFSEIKKLVLNMLSFTIWIQKRFREISCLVIWILTQGNVNIFLLIYNFNYALGLDIYSWFIKIRNAGSLNFIIKLLYFQRVEWWNTNSCSSRGK